MVKKFLKFSHFQKVQDTDIYSKNPQNPRVTSKNISSH